MHNRRIDEPVKIKRVITRMSQNRFKGLFFSFALVWRGGLGHLGGFLVKSETTEKSEFMLSGNNFAIKVVGITKFRVQMLFFLDVCVLIRSICNMVDGGDAIGK